ncbi:hypothetical protein [Runella sp.]|uniref:hypothetical protein n=1 Tax=Runella sp. TaxID=1960881 RepID=UPI003D118629
MQDSEQLIKDVKTAFYSIRKIIEERKKRWADWKSHVKENLKTTLESLNEQFKISLEVEIKDFAINLESVICNLKNGPSGFLADDVPYEKEFGFLQFLQIPNGKIQIIVGKPQIVGLVENEEPVKILGIIEPSELNYESILGYFVQYLAEVQEWESNPPTGFIGFVPGKKQI